MNQRYLKNLLIDLLALPVGSGDLINWLPQSLRHKCRENLRQRTRAVEVLESGLTVYQTLSARQWEQFQFALIKGEK